VKYAPLVTLFVVIGLSGCTAQQKQSTKDGAKDVDHAARDVTRETGHFFRDTAKEIFDGGSAETIDE
jgi:hypothetical protein